MSKLVMDVDRTLQHAFENYECGNLSQAETLCTKILKHDPDNAAALHLLGVIRYQLKQYESARVCIEKSLQLNPADPFAYFNLANICRDMNRFEYAIANYQKALGLNPDFADAYYNMGLVFEAEGQISDAVSCYKNALRINPNDAAAHNNLGVLLQRMGKKDEAIRHFQGSVRIAPGNFKAYYNLGLVLHSQGRFDEAIANYRKAILLNPDYADAYNDLGASLKEKGLLDEAEDCYKKTLQITPGRADTYYNLGIVLKEKGDIDGAITNYERAIRIDPGYLNAYNNLGIAYQDNGQLPRAMECYKKALQIDPDDPVTHWNLSHALLLTGNFEEGWKEYEWRLRVKELPNTILEHPLWDGADISGKTILLYAEQGFGDTIQFVRYARPVAKSGARIILACPKELSALLQDVEGVHQTVGRGDPLPYFDVYCHLLSLPRILGTTIENIPAEVPYITANPFLVKRWSEKMQCDRSRLKIGLVWAGNEQRSCSLKSFSPLSQFDNITFYSLQKGEASKEAKDPPEDMRLVDYTDEINDFSDTAALIQNLDLTISADTAVAHLAGALAKPVWILLPFSPDWRWMLGRDDSPWYPTMKLFRRSKTGDWNSLITDIAKNLERYP
jgi:tetratricopeptide (TPR) repeat protein